MEATATHALPSANGTAAVSLVPARPHWDAVFRVLHLGTGVVKRFPQRAANQEAILAAFEEEGWPARIDDPLSQSRSRQLPQDRLRDVVRRLNGHQLEVRIRFSCDGTGQGIRWEIVPVCSTVEAVRS